MDRRLKTPLILVLIACGINIICALLGLIYLAQYDNFFAYFELMMNTEIEEGMTILSYISSLLPDFSAEKLRSILYVYFIVTNVFSILLSIPGIIFSSITFKDNDISVEDFQARNKFHIWLLVSIGLAYFSNSYEMGSAIYSVLSTFSLAVIVLLVVAFIKVLRAVRYNKYAFDLYLVRKAKEEKEQANDYEFKPANNEFEYEHGRQIGEENLDKPVSETRPSIDQSKLDEMYQLLAKLEKSYKANEITFEDYDRMKKTILENYLKQN